MQRARLSRIVGGIGAVCAGALVTLGALSTPAAAQGETGFLRGTNRTDFSLSASYESFDHYFDGATRTSSSGVGTVKRETLNLNLAHGVDERTDLVLNVTYADAKNNGTSPLNDEEGFQDAVGLVKYKVSEERIGPGALSLLLEPGVRIPIAHYQTNTFNALGTGEVDFLGRFILHYRFDNGLFASVESGYDLRTQGIPDQVLLNATVGATILDRLTIAPFYSIVRTRGGIDISDIPVDGGFAELKEEYDRYGATAYLRLSTRYGLTGGYRTTRKGRNTGDTTAYWVGVVLKF